jgi:biotin carboxyl carrier protein
MRTYKLNIANEKYEVEVKSFNLKDATLVVNGKTLQVKINEVLTSTPSLSPSAASAPAASAPAPMRPASTPRVADGPGPAPAGGNALKAPIPGAILTVNVAVGDTVEAGQLVVKMEAMKMENQIKTTRAGKVTAVCVKPGDAVAQGQDLVVIE